MGWKPTPSMAVAMTSMFIALGSVAWAATAPKNSVTSKSIKAKAVKTGDLADAAVTNPKLAPDSVDGSKVVANSLKGDDVDESHSTSRNRRSRKYRRLCHRAARRAAWIWRQAPRRPGGSTSAAIPTPIAGALMCS